MTMVGIQVRSIDGTRCSKEAKSGHVHILMVILPLPAPCSGADTASNRHSLASLHCLLGSGWLAKTAHWSRLVASTWTLSHLVPSETRFVVFAPIPVVCNCNTHSRRLPRQKARTKSPACYLRYRPLSVVSPLRTSHDHGVACSYILTRSSLAPVPDCAYLILYFFELLKAPICTAWTAVAAPTLRSHPRSFSGGRASYASCRLLRGATWHTSLFPRLCFLAHHFVCAFLREGVGKITLMDTILCAKCSCHPPISTAKKFS
ncbi:hypothetical protein H4582DRAFT_607987 [Lactarius indigo]|nr:hypothetical protein H4582DRAFT_607987 [Lactarius indigo]